MRIKPYNRAELREFFAVDRLTIAWVDVETTGLEQQDEIVEAALYIAEHDLRKHTHEVRYEFRSLACPMHVHTWPDAQKIHQISPRMVDMAPPSFAVSAFVSQTIAGRIAGAHNASFDAHWIQSPEWICTLQLSRAMLTGKHSLARVADQLGIEFDETQLHHALDDARLAARVFDALTERIWSERDEHDHDHDPGCHEPSCTGCHGGEP